MREKKTEIPIYCASLTIVIDKDLSYVQKKYKTKSLKKYGAVTIKDKKNYRHYIVAFESGDRSLIAHEIVHIINYIYRDCGIKLDTKNDENQAYLTGWLFNEIDKFINNQ